MKEQLYKISVHYADGSGEVFKNTSLPCLTDDVLPGTKILTFEMGKRITCINWDQIRKYFYEAIPDDEVTEK